MKALDILCHDAENADALASLRDTVGMAQNRPPEGESDGSIGPATLNDLLRIADAFDVVQHTLASFG